MQVVEELKFGKGPRSAKGAGTVFNALGDPMAEDIFWRISRNTSPTSEELMSQVKVTRKQFYSRMSKMTKCGLIAKGKNLGWRLTPLGFVVTDGINTIDRGLKFTWQLKVIDDIGVDIPNDEREDVIKRIIPDEAIRKMAFGL